MTATLRRALAVAVGVTTFAASSTVAHSAWTATTSDQFVATTAAAVPLAAPNKPTCVWNGAIVTMSWNAITGAVNYPVYRVGVPTPLATPTTNSVTFTEANMGAQTQTHKYDLTVKAFNGAYSPDSPVVQVQFQQTRCV
ncbi:MAG: hypothetical protein ACRDPR_15640 [Nocardioidaceae bacterium]